MSDVNEYEVVPGSGRRLGPVHVDQRVTLRFDGATARELRRLANSDEATVSATVTRLVEQHRDGPAPEPEPDKLGSMARQRAESYDDMFADLVTKHGRKIARVIVDAVFGPRPRRRLYTVVRSDGTRVRSSQAVDARLIGKAKRR